jgi:potassium-transporting ATPase KdpC subunit
MPSSNHPRQLIASVRMLVVLTVLLGVLYPAAVWGLGRLGLAGQADGSLVWRDGVVVGSSLLGQNFADARHFHGRPSGSGYAGDTSGGSNLAPGASAQRDAVLQRRVAFAAANGGTAGPPDAVTASASGLDPQISPADARAQAGRVATATGLSRTALDRLIEQHIQGRVLGFLGEPRVNVLELNLALDAMAVG